MDVIEHIPAARQATRDLGDVALVPTMGALHEGHLSLIRRARRIAEHVAVSIFVNPAQFAPHEDLERYPRPIEHDLDLCRREGVSLVFNPGVDEMYPADEPELIVNVPALGDQLEGASRPGFFIGVCRVVAKLFSILPAKVACFGQKDFQQLRVVEAMTRALCLPIRIEACPIVREPDGLAFSSRNVYLEGDQRHHALGLHKALLEARRLVEDGLTDPVAVERAMAQVMRANAVEVDYAVLRHAATLAPLDIVNPETEHIVALVAGRLGPVRLIDNDILT